MRVKSKILLTLGVACLATGMVAGSAMAKDGNRGGKAKIAKASKIGKNILKVEVRGSITSIDATSVVLSGGATLPPQTCAIPAGSDVSAFAAGDRVRANCRSANGVLTLTKLKKRDKGDRLKIDVRGTVTALAADSITVDPGSGLPIQTCAIDSLTRVFGTPAVGDLVKLSCKSKRGAVLTAKRIKERNIATPGQIEVETKATVDALSPTSITVGPTTCAIADPALVATIKLGDFVEAKCTGNPLTLTRIHLED